MFRGLSKFYSSLAESEPEQQQMPPHRREPAHRDKHASAK
jgi:hypothetical protein